MRRFIATWTGAVCAALAALTLAPAAGAQTCREDCLTAGDRDVGIRPDLTARTFKVHVPASYDGTRSVPLLIDLHGFTSTAEEERAFSGQLQQSDKRGFIAVWPQGLARSWNGYGCCSTSHATFVRDVNFVRAIVDYVKRHANVDGARVYVTGISNGGALAQRVACEAADVVRAAASVSFPLNRDGCSPSRPITLYEIAGTADATIPYAGTRQNIPIKDIAGAPVNIQSAPQSLAAWKRNDGCSDTLSSRQIVAGSALEDVYRQCSGGVRTGLLTIVGGKHILYNGYTGRDYDGNNAPLDVSEYIWNEVFTD